MDREFKIRDFLKRIKNQIIINDSTTYKRVTVSGNHKGVSLRDEVLGSGIGTKKQFTIIGGDFILSKIDARNGAFGIIPNKLDKAIITGNFWTYSVDTNLIDTEWFFYFTHSYNFIQICIESSTGSTHRKYLDEKVFLNHKIMLPEIEEQKEMVKRYKNSSEIANNLATEIQTQKQLLSQLKQSILQEVIQGKLTADWRKQNPNTEPSSELLKRIKAEKDQLIKDKKIKKEKPLPPITKEEIPFELPDGWIWCRLGDINNIFLGGAAFSSSRFIPNSNIQVIRISNVKNDQLNTLKSPVYIDDKNANENLRNELFPRDILITMTGTREKRDYCFTVELNNNHFKNERLFLNQRVGCFRISPNIDSTFASLALKSQSLLQPVFESSTGSANQANISKNALLNIVFPLPPLEEQKAIVEKVENLMQKCTALEQEIKTSEANAQMLMQAVLKEAFEGKQEVVEV
jgi:type I restriction enzyme S subunit